MPKSLSNSVAVYTGTFDPVHLGHLDVIGRGSRLFDRLIVGVGNNPDKSPFFSHEERVALVRGALADLANVEVRPFDGLAVTFVRQMGSMVVLRGLRTTSDMENELTMALMNRALDPDIETVFLMAKEEFSHVSSSLLRQVATFGGDLGKFLPPSVRPPLQQRALELRQRHSGE